MPKPKDKESECEPMRMPHSIPRGLLRHVIIRLLQSTDMTGTEMMRVMSERTGEHWSPSPGSIYPLLSHLEEEGIIVAVRTEGRSKTYSLTEEGRARFSEVLHKRGDVEHKARLNRMMLLQLLEPFDRVHFHISGFNHALDHIADTIEEISASEKRKIGTRLKKTSKKLDSLIQRVEQGEA